MPSSALLTPCSNCQSLRELYARVDCTLLELTSHRLDNLHYQAGLFYDGELFHTLVSYRRILGKLLYNQNYLKNQVDLQDIVSRIKTIAYKLGICKKCVDKPPMGGTTTTTTTSSSSSTTSSSTSSTSHTTSSSSTSTTSSTTSTTTTSQGYDTILTFASSSVAGAYGLSAAIAAPSAVVQFDFNHIAPQVGTPANMDIFLSSALFMTIAFPTDYIGSAFRMVDGNGTAHSAHFVNGNINF